MEDHHEINAKRLREWLTSRHITHKQFASIMGVAATTVDGWCSNKEIGKNRKRKIQKTINDYDRRSRTPSAFRTRLNLAVSYATGSHLFTPGQWEEICRAATFMGLTPGEFGHNVVMHHIRRRKKT
ncbi:helix-turn-helix domain-containing protein [Akkermansia glycaniphila]|uniref:Lambda repressor-like dna-binding domain n=1 Tax=Akkermansia glycaniphila TaxID=1679444 RepID=A0A1C7PAX0_9BACT|nr:helix-turn-helix transcriptional regulator [Akkermansia glycaniphila]OCA02721.1 hypothetical protein AC781_08770 [Akkermansia glycaniphila]SEH97479.1 lambda repressor-like dna-binding domain [Akkermansia glycaniphila]